MVYTRTIKTVQYTVVLGKNRFQLPYTVKVVHTSAKCYIEIK